MNSAPEETAAPPVRLPHSLLKEGWWLVDDPQPQTGLPAQERAALAGKVRSALAWDEWQRPRDWRSWTFRAARLDRYLRDHTILAR